MRQKGVKTVVEISQEDLAALRAAISKTYNAYNIKPIKEELMKLSSPGGDIDIDSEPTPANEVRFITSVSVIDEDNAPSAIRIGVYDGVNNFWHKSTTATAAGETVTYTGQLVLGEIDKIRARLEGTTLGDDLYCYINGYKVSL